MMIDKEIAKADHSYLNDSLPPHIQSDSVAPHQAFRYYHLPPSPCQTPPKLYSKNKLLRL